MWGTQRETQAFDVQSNWIQIDRELRRPIIQIKIEKFELSCRHEQYKSVIKRIQNIIVWPAECLYQDTATFLKHIITA